MSEVKAGVIVWVAITVILVLLGGVLRACESANFNGGICTNCGGHYVYQQAVGHQVGTSYVYKCEQCGRLLEVSIKPSGDTKKE